MRIYLAQPLWATSDLQQATMRDAMIRDCRRNLPGEHIFIYTTISPFALSKSPLGYLAHSLLDMANADATVFCHAWQTHRDCAFLYEIAKHYFMSTYEIDRFPWVYDEANQDFVKQTHISSHKPCIELTKHFSRESLETTLHLASKTILVHQNGKALDKMLQETFPKAGVTTIQSVTSGIQNVATKADWMILESLISRLIEEGGEQT